MAHKIEILRGATTYVLNDPSDASNPFSVEDGAGLGGASVRNIEEHGPYQDGSTHLDERLEPSVSTWRIFVKGATAAALDGHRDTLNKMFKPIRGVPIIVKYTRDDGAIRYQDTRRTGPLDIPLTKEHRPGNLHKAVVQLRAADPTWYDSTEESEVFVVPSSDWWLAYGNIGTANVLEHANSPTQGQAWTNAGSVVAGSAWTIVFRSNRQAAGTAALYAFTSNTVGGPTAMGFSASTVADSYLMQGGTASSITGNLMAAGTHNYFAIHNGGTLTLHRDETLIGTDSVGNSLPIPGTASGTARWRSLYSDANVGKWTEAFPNAAAYNIALNDTQHLALNQVMNIGSAYSVSVPYLGDVDSYPVITILGPMSDPVITNSTTGDTLDFTGGTVGTAEIWTIETRYGRKSVLNGAGSSVERYLSPDSDLATFRLVPDPIATGGTNVITLSGSATGTASAMTLSYYNRYISY